jgi:hypothetical protein
MTTASKITKKHTRHYVYKITNLFPENNERFYIGVRSCSCDPKKDNYWGSSKYLNEAINHQGAIDFVKEILSTWKTREEANAEEERIHKELGVMDNPEYYNKSNGAKGFFNAERTKESRMKLSVMNKERCAQPEVKKHKSETTKKLWEDPEYRKKVISKNKERWADPEFIKKMARVRDRTTSAKDFGAKISIGVTRKWADPEFKARMCLINKAAANTPERKARQSENAKKQWENPEFRKAKSEQSKKMWENPEYREKMKKLFEHSNHKRKKIYKLIDPEGIAYTLEGVNAEGGLKDFAKEHDMCATTLQQLCNNVYIAGKDSKYYGWVGSKL